MNVFKKHPIIFILIFYCLMALAGIFYNYPLAFTVGDEVPIMAAALKMISNHTLRPNFPSYYHMAFPVYIYLPFYVVLLLFLRISGAFTSMSAIKTMGIMDYGKLLLMARFISVVLGVVSIYLVYKVCRKAFSNDFIPLTASFLLSTSLMFIQMSHFGRVWLPQIFTILLSFYFIMSLYLDESAKFKYYFLSAVFIGVSLGTHFIGLLVYFPFLTVHYLKNKGKKLKDIFVRNANFWLANLIILIFFPVLYYLNPYGFVNYGGSVLKLFSLSAVSGAGFSFSGFAGKSLYYLNILWEYEPLLLLLFVFGIVVLFFKKRDFSYIFFSFVFGYYISASLIIGERGCEPRFILPVIPFMAIVAAYGVYYLFDRNLSAKKIKIFLLIILFLPFFYLPFLWNFRFIQSSTRTLAMDWIYRNLPTGTKIVNLDAYLTLNKNRQSVENLKKYNASFFTKKDDYLLSIDDRDYPQPNYYLLDAHYINEVPEEFLEKNKFQYLISYWRDNQQRNEQLEEISKFYLVDELALAAKFYPGDEIFNTTNMTGNMRNPFYLLSKIDRPGPYIEIYQIKNKQ